LDWGLAGTLAAAVWCLHRFHRLDPEHVARRGRAARLRALAVSWSATGVVVAGASACAVAAAALGGAMNRDPAAAMLYLGACAAALLLLAIVEVLTAAFRLRLAREAARKRARRMSVRTLMRTAPNSQSPL
jgi:predicted lysophospholipase L1 biosynthesis ABC-type transport system permease subunit